MPPQNVPNAPKASGKEMSYGCYNHPETDRKTVIPAQTGWTHDGRRIMQKVETQWAETQCGHDFSDKDEMCNECRWQKPRDSQV